jgi:DNA-binding response OmpR family regulator
MGPGSVEGWLARVVDDELGVDSAEAGGLFDAGARELNVPEGRVPLTPLEYALLALLHERAGKAVSRAEILERVWGYDASSTSNVVDAVVLTLRKKLGAHASVLETVRGVGYRYRPPDPAGALPRTKAAAP